MGGKSKSVRLHWLVQVLSAGKHYVTASELAKLLDVAERTIYRDIGDLHQLGYSVYNDRGYKLLVPEPKKNIPITPEDVTILKRIIDVSPLNRLPYMKERSDILIAKISASFCTDEDPSFQSHQSIEPSEAEPSSPFVIDVGKLERAINKERVVSILYHSLDESAPSQRLIHPYVITIRSGNWYLIAYTQDKQEFRQYRLERILSLSVQKETFQRDSAFNLQEYFRQSLGVFRGELVRIKLRLTGKAARLAAERPWPDDMTMDWTSDDSAILEVTLQGTKEIVAWALSLGEEAEILEPQSHRAQIYTKLNKICDLYK